MLEMSTLIGADRIRRPRGLEAFVAETIVEPQSVAELTDLVRKCETDRITTAPIGACRTLSVIRPRPVEIGVSLCRLARIEAYDSADMTVAVGAGETLEALNAQLLRNRQHLPFDPPFPEKTTIGSLIGAAHTGPRRLRDGLVRDLIIGIEFVGHRGRVLHGGGRVVKNVAGYDLMRLLTGSFGTLGIVTQAAFKVLPLPPRETLATASFDSFAEAWAAAKTLNDLISVAHLEVLSPGCELFTERRGFVAVAGFSGNQVEDEHYRRKILEAFGARLSFLEGDEAGSQYAAIRDFEVQSAHFVAQLSVPPGLLENCIEKVAQLRSVEFVAYAGSGVVKIFVGGGRDANELANVARRMRAIARTAHGHLRLKRAPRELTAAVAVFDEPNAPAFALMRRLKQTFDPAGIFNPGCFVGGL